MCQSCANLHVWKLALCACIYVSLHALINFHDVALVHNYPNQQLRARASSSSWGGSPTSFFKELEILVGSVVVTWTMKVLAVKRLTCRAEWNTAVYSWSTGGAHSTYIYITTIPIWTALLCCLMLSMYVYVCWSGTDVRIQCEFMIKAIHYLRICKPQVLWVGL